MTKRTHQGKHKLAIMYEQHFGFDHKPFAITPDPRYLYLSDRHREALAHLLYGVSEGGGFVQLTGEVGTGKTTLCRSLLEQLPPEVDIALILNPRLDAVELVAAICDELKASCPPGCTSLKVLVGILNDHLLQSHAAGRRTVLVIDEAQNLTPDVLEQLRLLTNLETSESKLLEIILLGQPELREILERPELRQLAQRITARYHLGTLSPEETMAYVRHRLRVAGVSRPLFTPGALKSLVGLSGGVPRLINVICDRALLGAYVEDRNEVDKQIIQRAAREVQAQGNLPERWRRSLGAPAMRRRLLAAMLVLALIPAAVLAHRTVPEYIPVWPTENMAGEQHTAASTDVLEQRLAALDGEAEAAAWEDLFRLWGAEYHADRSPCDQARELGLQCLEDTGNWTMLRRLDRPALLRLNGPDGTGTALLATLEQDRAVIILAGEELTLPVNTLEQYWHGDYRILWRPPLEAELLREGDRGPEVEQLRTLLARQDQNDPGHGREKETASADPQNSFDYFDAELTSRVVDFQAAHGLQTDGIVGPRTLLWMSRPPAGPETPRLTPTEKQEVNRASKD